MKEDFKQFIVARHFFPTYAPQVKSAGYKLRGKDGRNKAREFTDVDLQHIAIGLRQLALDLETSIVNDLRETDPAIVVAPKA